MYRPVPADHGGAVAGQGDNTAIASLPFGRRDVGRRGRDFGAFPRVPAVGIPPAGAVGDVPKTSVIVPLGLGDRLIAVTGDPFCGLSGARHKEQLATVPRHLLGIPPQPGETVWSRSW